MKNATVIVMRMIFILSYVLIAVKNSAWIMRLQIRESLIVLTVARSLNLTCLIVRIVLMTVGRMNKLYLLFNRSGKAPVFINCANYINLKVVTFNN